MGTSIAGGLDLVIGDTSTSGPPQPVHAFGTIKRSANVVGNSLRSDFVFDSRVFETSDEGSPNLPIKIAIIAKPKTKANVSPIGQARCVAVDADSLIGSIVLGFTSRRDGLTGENQSSQAK